MTENNNTVNNKIEVIKNTIKSYPDFPQQGILFRDMFPVFTQPNVLRDMIDIMVDHIKSLHPDTEAIIGLESRGFLLGPMISLNLCVPFIPIRKAGKLPGRVSKVSYALEYGDDSVEIQSESISKGMKCIIVDDLIATGGSLSASIKLVEGCGGIVLKSMVVMELIGLKGRNNIPTPLYSMIQY